MLQITIQNINSQNVLILIEYAFGFYMLYGKLKYIFGSNCYMFITKSFLNVLLNFFIFQLHLYVTITVTIK